MKHAGLWKKVGSHAPKLEGSARLKKKKRELKKDSANQKKKKKKGIVGTA